MTGSMDSGTDQQTWSAASLLEYATSPFRPTTPTPDFKAQGFLNVPFGTTVVISKTLVFGTTLIVFKNKVVSRGEVYPGRLESSSWTACWMACACALATLKRYRLTTSESVSLSRLFYSPLVSLHHLRNGALLP
jgi:hypothetical protein